MLVAAPGPPDHELIPNVDDEVHTVAGLVCSVSAEVINDVNTRASVTSVLNNLSTSHILHLACHGHQQEDPLNSSFALNDGPLTISSLMHLNLPNAMLAFLSACETAKGDRQQPDQAVHLAASMLFCGFKSVIATMWQVIFRLDAQNHFSG
jgi:CHAT domain-containing protein